MNLPRISWKQFLKSRWFPWALVLFLLASGGRATYERYQYKKESERLDREVRSLTFEVAQAEWALKQEQEKQRATKKTREERRPDGTVVVEREETEEATTTKTESSGSTSTTTSTEVVERETVERQSETESSESSGGGRWGLDVGIHRQFVGNQKGNRVSVGYELDYGIAPVIDVQFDNTFTTTTGFGLGIEVRF